VPIGQYTWSSAKIPNPVLIDEQKNKLHFGVSTKIFGIQKRLLRIMAPSK